MSRHCAACAEDLPLGSFSKSQLNKGEGASRCSNCVQQRAGAGQAEVPGAAAASPSPVCTDPRPQLQVPGFADLSCCADWPQTKRGQPPGAQSAIFNPLLACALGPIDGHCSADQLALAVEWWVAALPAWSIWIEKLRAAGIAERRSALLATSKGQATPLIHRARGRGTVPHFNGRAQNDALELDPGVATEVYACVMCMYSAAAFEVTEGAENGAHASGLGEVLSQEIRVEDTEPDDAGKVF